MPVFTDSLLVGEVVRRVGVAMTDRVLIAPLMWLGNSHHHMDFPGTAITVTILAVNLFGDALRDFLDPKLT
jgi:creatinine amidohydrolase